MCQYKGYKSEDPAKKQQQALIANFIRQAYHRAVTPREHYIARLIILAYFFAMRACEYTISSRPRKTHPVVLGRMVFRLRNCSIILHTSNEIFSAHTITLAFIDQKIEKKWNLLCLKLELIL